MKPIRANGFSLIELMVVMAIIALLLTIALPRYQASIEKAREEALLTNLKVMRHGIERYYEDKGQYPESLPVLVEARYLKAIPIDPVTESADTWIVSEELTGGRVVVVDVASGAKGMSSQGLRYSEL
ncbi:MAG TPA: type II secretion system protein [Xanthomonadaceae bacterium]